MNATLNVAPVVDELTVTPQTVFVNASHSPFQVPPAELHTVDLGDAQPGQVLTGTGIRSSKGSVYEGGVRVPLIVAGASSSGLEHHPSGVAALRTLAGYLSEAGQRERATEMRRKLDALLRE